MIVIFLWLLFGAASAFYTVVRDSRASSMFADMWWVQVVNALVFLLLTTTLLWYTGEVVAPKVFAFAVGG